MPADRSARPVPPICTVAYLSDADLSGATVRRRDPVTGGFLPPCELLTPAIGRPRAAQKVCFTCGRALDVNVLLSAETGAAVRCTTTDAEARCTAFAAPCRCPDTSGCQRGR